MRLALAGLLLVVSLLSGMPVQAQSAERVIFDAEIWVFPSEFSEGHCLQLEPGSLTVSLQATGERSLVYPVEFSFGAYRNLYSPSNIRLAANRAQTVATAPLEGGLYCYSLANTVFVPEGIPNSERTNLSQVVQLRMTIQPSA